MVFYAVNKKNHLRETDKSVPSPVLLLLLGAYLLLAFLTQLVEDDMPRVVNEADVEINDPYTFSEEAAWRYLDIILGDEPRVCGTPYHLQKTQDLKELLDEVARGANQRVRTDWQFADGDNWLTFGSDYVNVYQNVSNVIALLEGESGYLSNGTIGPTLLVNCHYDSVPYAMGASDDAIFCAVMVEVLSRLSKKQQPFKHNIVFLFNGAEENLLQGSHAFLQHPWFKGVTNVINLDAAGMNGKPLVFQISDPRILYAYRRVVNNPAGQSVGEFLFGTGIIPSDTDFRIWREFGDIHGIDIAFYKWGHVYHTRYDHPNLVLAGVMQNTGNMVLRLVTELADMEELEHQVERSAAVYYDYLNWFMVTYSLTAAIAVDVLVAIFAILSVAYFLWPSYKSGSFDWSSVQELLYAMLSRLTSMVAGIIVCAIFTPIMIATTIQLRYLSEAWVVVPHYWLPYIITAVCVSQLFDAWRVKKISQTRSVRSLQAQAATRFLLAILLLALCIAPSLATIRYMLTVPLFLMSLMSIVSLTVARYVKPQAWQQLLMEFLLSLPSIMFLLSLALRFDAIMLPTMGRNPGDNPDVIIAILNVGMAILISSTVSGMELLFSRKRMWLPVVPVAVTCIILMFIPFHPYQDDGPATQRHYWFHTEVTSYNFNGQVTDQISGVVVTRHDAYSTDTVLNALEEKGLNYTVKTDWSEECEQYIYCNLPLYRVGFGDTLKDSIMLSTGPPAPFDPQPSLQVANRSCVGQLCTLDFVLTGPAHNLITIWPRANVVLSSWSFDTAPQNTSYQIQRPVFVIVHSTATYSHYFLPLQFTIQFIVPTSQQSQPIVDISHHAHKIHHPEDYTSEFRNLINSMPQYFNFANFMSFRKNYVF